VVHVASNDADENPFRIRVVGNGPPEIDVQTTWSDLVDGTGSTPFSAVPVGALATRHFIIRNHGSGDLVVGAVTVGGTNSAGFALASNPASIVAPGATTTFSVVFSPTNEGARNAVLQIQSDDGDEAVFDIALTGSGIAAASLTNIEFGTKVSGNLFNPDTYPEGDSDFYSFEGQAGDRVSAAMMTFASASSGDAELRLLASDGITTLEYDDDGGSIGTNAPAIAGAVLPADGRYFLQARAKGDRRASICPYDLYVSLKRGVLDLEMEPNDVVAQPLPASRWVSGSTSATNDSDYFSLDLNAGETLFASLDLDPERDGVTWNGYLGIGSFGNPPRTGVTSDPSEVSPNAESFFMTVKTAGTYRIFVGVGPGATNCGSYHLSASVLSASTVRTTTYMSTDTPVAIPAGPSVITSSLSVTGNHRIGKIRVHLNLVHTNMPDLDISLTAPGGNVVGLVRDDGSSVQTGMDTILDDDAALVIGSFNFMAGPVFKPQYTFRLDWLRGQQAQGIWTLTVHDDAAGNGGHLSAWGLEIQDEAQLPGCVDTEFYNSDFESDDGGFTHTGTGDEWERGTPSYAPITNAAGGAQCWKTDLDGPHDNNTTQSLFSPLIALTNVSSSDRVFLSWAMKYQLELCTLDTAHVEVNEVGGAGAHRKVWQWTGPTMTTVMGNPAGTIQESAGWGIHRADITDFAGKSIQVKVVLQSDDTITHAGLAIDDVRVFSVASAAPAGVLASNTVIASHGFEPADAWTLVQGAIQVSTNTGTGDEPAGERIMSGSHSWQVTASNATMELAPVCITGYRQRHAVVHLAAVSPMGTNGLDNNDYVHVFVALDGEPFSSTPAIILTGSGNALWSYQATNKLRSTVGSLSSNSAPQTGFSSNSYASLIIDMPDYASEMALRITARASTTQEMWCVDNIAVHGYRDVPADSDGDGLDDLWEDEHFVDLGTASQSSDYDGDGYSDMSEYLAGSDPTDDSSLLSAVGADVLEGNGVVLSWQSHSGTLYSVSRSTNLDSAFTGVFTNIPSSPPMTSVTDTPPDSPVWIYRIEGKRTPF
jgi:subtilisin-like proprotein convertase family protein